MKQNNLPRWKKIEITQSLFGLAVLILIISTSAYYFYMPPTVTSQETIRALKIATGAPPGSITTIIPIRIWVTDENGNIDKRRNDVIKIDMAPSRILQLRQSQVNLVQGEATIEVYAIQEGQDNVLLTAVWVSGDSYLEPASMLVVYPPLGAGG